MEILFEERDTLVIKSTSVSINKGTGIRKYIKEKDFRLDEDAQQKTVLPTGRVLTCLPFSKNHTKSSARAFNE